MVSPLILTGAKGSRFFLNIDRNVGPGCPNQADDVQLVQLGYVAILQNPANKSLLSAAERQAFAKIRPGAHYTGSRSDPLSIAIGAHEASRGGAADGHVSVMMNSIGYDSQHTYIVSAMNNALRDIMPFDFPRLDKHPLCPPPLRSSILRILMGRTA